MDENKDKACHHHSPGIYQPRHPENTVLYQILQEDLETWITQTQENGGYVASHVEKDFREYLKCGLLCHGFARVRCTCGNEFLVAFSCKGHGICPSCNARRMVETAAHLVDHVFPKAPVRQWVLSLPKRIRYFLYHNPKITSKVLRIFLDEIRKQLIQHYQTNSDNPIKIGGISFIHRFGSSLNAHPHFHCIIIEGVFVKNSDSQIKFHKISTLTEKDIQSVQERVRLRVLKSFKRSGLLEAHDVENMKTWNGGGGFSVNGSAYIHENDREGRERLIRYCARPPFSLERITKQSDGSIIYRLNKPLVNGQTLLRLTSLELIDKLAALIPPPRIHRHRYYGVLAPNSPFRASVTAMAGQSLDQGAIKIQTADKKADPVEQAQEDKPKRPPNRYLWAMLLARIYNLFPLLCPQCGAEMQVIAVIQDKPVINKILKSVGEAIEPPVLSPARGPPGWDDYNQDLSVAENKQSIPDFEFNQCVSW